MNNDDYKQLVGFLEKQFTKIDEKFEKIDKRFEQQDQKFEDVKSYVGVIVEDLKSDLRAVAEGHGVLQNQIETQGKETKKEIAGVSREIESLKKEFIEHRRDNEKSFKELLSAIKISYADLDHRMTSFEAELQTLRQRVEQLEAR